MNADKYIEAIDAGFDVTVVAQKALAAEIRALRADLAAANEDAERLADSCEELVERAAMEAGVNPNELTGLYLEARRNIAAHAERVKSLDTEQR